MTAASRGIEGGVIILMSKEIITLPTNGDFCCPLQGRGGGGSNKVPVDLIWQRPLQWKGKLKRVGKENI